MDWHSENEQRVIELKDRDNKTFKEIAEILGTTLSSVKHKYNRLKQKNNEVSKHHPLEKIEQINRYKGDKPVTVLETHMGYGNLTNHYTTMAKSVTAYEINQDKVNHVEAQQLENVTCIKGDSLRAMYNHIHNKDVFDWIDLDPYGMPSKYLPLALELINDGVLIITLPKYGCQQINKIMRIHLLSYYGFEGTTNAEYLECFLNTLKRLAMQTYRLVEDIDIVDVGNIYRIAVRVRKESAFKLAGYDHLSADKSGISAN